MRTRSFVALLPLVLAVGCSDDPTQPATPTGDMEIALSHVVTDPTTRGVQDLVLGSDMLRYETPFGNMFSVDNLHYFISNVTLHSPEGDVSFDLIHYVDASDHDTHTIHLHDVPPATCTRSPSRSASTMTTTSPAPFRPASITCPGRRTGAAATTT